MTETINNETSHYKSIVQDLQVEIPKKMKELNIPGLAIAIVSRDEVIWIKGFGYTDKSKKQEVNAETLFSLQSTTKSVTAIAFLLAVQKGLVSLDDPIIKYYSDFSVNSRFGDDQVKKITFRHLLSHSSGLARETRLGGCFNDAPCSWEEHIQSISGSWLKFPVGEGFSYSNAGMDLVAYLLERITGKPYPDYLQEVLGDPLGITFRFYVKDIYRQPNAAKGYLDDFEAVHTDDLGLGCGVCYLSIKDLATFVRFLLGLGKWNNKQILSTEHVRTMINMDRDGGYGLGTFELKDFGTSTFYHPGGGFGLACTMYWSPEHDTGVAVFINSEYAFEYLGSLAKKVLKRILKAKGVPSESTDFPYSDASQIQVNPKLFQKLIGMYCGTWDCKEVALADSILKLNNSELLPVFSSKKSLVFKTENARGVIFQFSDQGKPLMKFYSNYFGILDLHYIGQTSDQQGPNKEEWKKFIGLYRFSFYSTEAYYQAINIEDGYLFVLGDGKQRLYEHENIPNLFFTIKGDAILFKEDHLYNDNIKGIKIDDPVKELSGLAQKNPNHRYLQGWMLDQAINYLKQLERKEEAEKINQLKQNLEKN
ncbi:MAG: serine hydrolase domain-containing protein [Candidatus Hodarchaeota archaeon]